MKNLQLILLITFLTFAVSCGQQKQYVEYKVKKGETMRMIAKRLKMKTRELLELNEGVGRRPQENTVIIIPKQGNNKNNTSNTTNSTDNNIETKDTNSVVEEENSKDKEEEEDEVEYITHEVKKGDTFFRLTRLYNVTQSKMVELNPALKDGGLKVGQVLNIKPKSADEEGETSSLEYTDIIEKENAINVAMLLPFKASSYDTISAKDLYKNNRLATIVSDYFLGTEIALDSLNKMGIKVNVSVFDTEDKLSKIDAITKENDLNAFDVIIGPFYAEEAKVIANRVSIPVVFPMFSKTQRFFASSRLIKTSPDKSIYKNFLVSYLKDVYTKEKIIIIGDGKPKSNFDRQVIRESLKQHDSIKEVHFIAPEKGYIAKEKFEEVLTPETTNWVLIATDDDVIIENSITNLIGQPDSIKVKVFATEKSRAFNKIENKKLARIGFTYVSDSYIDTENEATNIYKNKYFEKNNAYPTYYSNKGFDIMYDVVMRLASNKTLKETFSDGYSRRIQNKFNYSKKLFNTTDNKGLFIIEYQTDLRLILLR